jgi:multiple sugar transport system substrate-binding protein
MRRYLRYLKSVLVLLPLFSLLALAPDAYAQKGDVLTVWWNKGYYQEEDQAVKQFVQEWEKKTGNKVKLSFYSTEDLPVKLVAAISTGNVPDVAYGDQNDFFLTPEQAWKGTLVDLSDVVNPVKGEYTQTALQSTYLYNDKAHKRSYYAVPLKQQALHIFYWRPLLEKAGFKSADVPKTWDAFWKFWQTVQDKLRAEGQRVYTMGLPVSSTGTDNYYVFNQLLLGYGAHPVDKDGHLQVSDPKFRQAAIDLVTFLSKLYKDGYIPPSAINWGDGDNNAAFMSRQIVMTTNPSLSIPAALHAKKDVYEHELVTQVPPLARDGKPMRSLVAVKSAVVPVGAKHVELAKQFLSFLVQPKILDQYLKTSQGRWLPVMPGIIKNDAYWTDASDPHIPVATEQEVTGPTAPWPQMLNPAYAQVNSQEVWGQAVGSVLVGGVSPAAAVDKAIARIKKIFDNYKIPAK